VNSYVALSADHLVAVKLRSKGLERWLDNTTTKTENKMEGRFLWYIVSKDPRKFAPLFNALWLEHLLPSILIPPFHSHQRPLLSNAYLLDVVVRKGASVLKLLSGKDQSLLVGGNSFLVLDLGLNIVDRIGGLHLKGDSLARKGFDEAIYRTLVLYLMLTAHGMVKSSLECFEGSYICTERENKLA